MSPECLLDKVDTSMYFYFSHSERFFFKTKGLTFGKGKIKGEYEGRALFKILVGRP